jgi:MoaA/NifB/PqqE/SkfB family radical SAM enzyme
MIRYAREKHIWVRTTPNASLLHLKDNYRKMIDADVNELQISVDGASKQVYEGIRRGANY